MMSQSVVYDHRKTLDIITPRNFKETKLQKLF